MNISVDRKAPSIQDDGNDNGPSSPIERGSTSAVVVPVLPMAGLPASELEPRKRSSAKPPKPMQSRQLYSSITGAVAGTVYFDVPADTVIRSITFGATAASYSASDYIELEVSTSATSQTRVQDAQGVIAVANFGIYGGGTPANVSAACLNFTVPCNIAVRRGTRIYLNGGENGTATWTARALVWFD